MPAGSALERANANAASQIKEKVISFLEGTLAALQNMLARAAPPAPPPRQGPVKAMAVVKQEFGNEPVGSGCQTCDAAAAGANAQAAPKQDPNSKYWLKVPRGQLTFDVEGDGDETLVPHLPPAPSGVTIGRGLDLGKTQLSKQEVQKLFKDINLSQEDSDLLMGAYGKNHDEAKSYIAHIEGKIKITREQQYHIFNVVYDKYAKETENYWTYFEGNTSISNERPFEWSKMNPTIQEILIDFKYRGDWVTAHLRIIKPGYDNNSLEKLLVGLDNEDYWAKNTNMKSRSTKRANYVRDRIPK